MNKRAITLIEILVSAVILALLMTALVNLFVAGKRYIVHTRSRMTGGELGKLFLDDFQMLVNERTWNINFLGTGARPNQIIDLERRYTGVYTINNNQPIANINRVSVVVRWDEPAP
ncbi:MAG: type II secretion system protein [Candidatus Omnitrophica bacterium]|nr:type II secretion system protein [Candidatus Omnitrophota bacterium]